MSTSRLESFSDGVLAVAITLLILNITVPAPHEQGAALGHELGLRWPEYAAYVTSFVTIGIIWINHHVAIGRLARVDHGVMFINLLLLMSVVFIPFATALMATYLREAHGEDLAAAVYGGSLLLMGVMFGALNHHMLYIKTHLLRVKLPDERRRQILFRNLAGVTPYVAATALAFVSPYITLAISAAVALFYALPLTVNEEP